MKKSSMNKILLWIVALSFSFSYGCFDENPTKLSDTAWRALNVSGLLMEKGEIFKTSYHEGYYLNFAITEGQAASLLPTGFVPLSLKITEDDTEAYYLSWYMAVLEGEVAVKRIDLFTYATDPEGETTLYFVSSYISIPQIIQTLGMFDAFKEIFDAFARDSATGEPAYPHYYTDTFTVNSNTFNLAYEGSSISISTCDPEKPTGTLTNEFIIANSYIYRTAYDKNNNYFNSSFMKANVETRDISPSCLTYTNLEGFHPMLSYANLKSIQFYGSPDKTITWYYESCSNNVCGSPFIW